MRHGGEEARLGAACGLGLIARQRERGHLGFVQFPIAVGQFFDALFQRPQPHSADAAAKQQERDDRTGGGKQRAGANRIGVRIVSLGPKPDAGKKAERHCDDGERADDGAAEQH